MNMNKVYRAELRDLKKAEAKLDRDFKLAAEHLYREKVVLEQRLERACLGHIRAGKKIQRRRAILEGRLS